MKKGWEEGEAKGMRINYHQEKKRKKERNPYTNHFYMAKRKKSLQEKRKPINSDGEKGERGDGIEKTFVKVQI